ncbi:hypothetical protein [Streptomyces sp. NBC_00102]|uniref:hypothetical protein n=1 Tax=Streptomyces sp. NBC_00102 TaxID=2975652 RepID=UPI002252FE35|nr:hypothetical protein [Streptomyces sp. NBC_00102]MCX5398599.1 hypothetical protein [Streptomyces sp. NBC_00102]
MIAQPREVRCRATRHIGVKEPPSRCQTQFCEPKTHTVLTSGGDSSKDDATLDGYEGRWRTYSCTSDDRAPRDCG